MAPKRKATDTGASTSPLKKRNAVTAGIGRAVEPENNGIAYNYYGRTDDREDVSKPINSSIPLPVMPLFVIFFVSCAHQITNLFTFQYGSTFEAARSFLLQNQPLTFV